MAQEKQVGRREFLKASGITVGGMALRAGAQREESAKNHEVKASRISLGGNWDFQLDPLELGLDQKWFLPGRKFDDTIHVPGSWQGQGKGYKTRQGPGQTRVDYEAFEGLDPKWLVTPGEYLGTAWYHRRIVIPASWQDAEVWLCFSGVHSASMFWLDGELIGEHCGGPC